MSVPRTPISRDTPPIPAQVAPGEATIAQSLKYADELYGSNFEVMERHYNEEGSYLGQGALNLFCQTLCGHPFEDARDYQYMDTTFAFVGLKIRPSHFLKYIEYLIKFVEQEGKANESIAEFICGIKDLPEWTFGAQEELTCAWSIFWNALSFNPDIPLSLSASFESRIAELLQRSPPNAARITPALKLKANLMDFECLGIKVRPTLNLDEHMTLEDDTLKVLKLSCGTWTLCLTYHENLVAKALKIDTLGSEVLGSLFTLYREAALMKKAGDMELLLVESDQELPLWTWVLSEDYNKVTPRLLASRMLAVSRLVEKRRSWWPTLIRDIKLQSSTHPIIFYGSILAFISVFSDVVQAVATVWGLVIAIKLALILDNLEDSEEALGPTGSFQP